MFNKLKNEVKVYADAVTDAKLKFNQEKEKIDKNFIGGMWAEEYAKIKEEYENTLHNLRTSFKQSTDETFSKIREKIKSAITADLTSETIAELNLIRDMELTKFEIRGYFEKYLNNPKALKIVSKIAKKNGFAVELVTMEDVLLALKELETECNRFKDSYDGGDISSMNYLDALFISGSRIDTFETVYNEFLKPTIL